MPADSTNDGWELAGVPEFVWVLGGIVLLGGIGFLAYQAEPKFLQLNFWQLLFTNTAGVLLGGYLALWANRWVTEHQERSRREEERRKERERANQALGALRKAVLHNEEQVDDVLTALDEDPESPVFSNADPEAFDPILSRLVETVDDFLLIREASNFRHRLTEFSRMAEAQLNLYLLPERRPEGGTVGHSDIPRERIERRREQVLDKLQRFGGRLLEQADDLRQAAADAEKEIEG